MLMKKFTSSMVSFQFTKYFFSRTIVGLLLTLAFTLQLQAQNPKISIQGTLRAANGTSVADGTYNVTFKFYRDSTGGTALWQETAPVEVVGSIYSHYLGSITALDGADFDSTIYLGVVVNNYELIPRTELSYSPYALSVAFAQKVVCSGAVGDVKYSILNPTQFAAVNGDCWVPMDGRTITGSSLAMISGLTMLPDGGGLFIRGQEFSGGADNDPERSSGSAIATLQQDVFESHNHSMNTAGSHAHALGTRGFLTDAAAAGLDYNNGADGSGDDQNAFSQSAGSHTHTINDTGGAETRPKNLNFWVYIRIN